MTKNTNKLAFKEKLAYGLGDTASHFVWDMVGFWIMIFYTDTFGISAAAAGTIMLIARVWDMISDPLMGVISDRTNTRWGKFRPYILWMSIPYGVLAVLTFTTPDFGENGKVIYAGVTYVLLMTVYTAINLPYSSLGAVMTNDTYERAGLNTYRFVSAFTGQLIVTGLALTLANYFGGGDKAKGYQYTLMVFGAFSIVIFMITFFFTKERVQPPKSQQSSLIKDIKNLITNRPWLIMAIVGIVSFIMFAVQNLSIAYYFKYYIGKEEDVQIFNVVSSIALIVALPLAKPLAKKFGNRNVFIASSILSGIFFALLFIPGESDITLIYIFNILAKISYAPAVPLLWTMIADTADYSEWKNGRRATGLFFSAATFAQKAGWGIGAYLAGMVLTMFNYKANAPVTEETIHGIKLLVSIIPGILYMSCAAFLIFYNIDSKTADLMKVELEKRREEENSTAEN